MIGIESE